MSAFRVATFNVHHCEGLDGRIDIERTGRVITEIAPDLIALQELDSGMVRSGKVDQPSELERLIGMNLTFHPTLERGEGRYGIALASRSGGGSFEYRALPRVRDEEPRGYLIGPWKNITVIATHVATDGEPRDAHTKALLQLLDGIHGPFLLLGDLNQGFWRLRRRLSGRASIGWWPRRTMARRWAQRDHIVGGGGVRVFARDTRPADASDHRPLLASVELP